MKDIFYRNPLLKLAIPLIAGIALSWACDVGTLYALSFFAFSVIAMLLGVMRFAPRWLFGTGVMVMMFSVGLFVEHKQSVEKQPLWGEEKLDVVARLVEVPAVRGTNVKVLAELSHSEGSLEGRKKGLVYLYFPRTVDTEKLSAGDVLALETKISNPKNQGNPEEFDIERFYYIKNITGTAFVKDGEWEMLPANEDNFCLKALKLRSKVVKLYEKMGFENEGLALLSALTLGEKRDFPQELKENYSVAGASHILALSGLHLGIFYMLLTTVLPARRSKLVIRLLRESVIVAVLWGFVFVAGVSPSVVRAAVLFTLMSFGRIFEHEVSPVSSLSFAAIIMLLFNPHLLFDVSFQLSYSAVLSILLLAPPLQELLAVYKHGTLYGYVVNLLILSLVSQIGTLPFIWFHFGVFPVYFLLTNLFVVPLAFVLMMLAVFLWLLSPLPMLAKLVSYPLAWVVDFMNWLVGVVASLPGASYALPMLNLPGAICVALLIVFLAISLIQKRLWLFLLTVCTAVLLLTISVCGEKGKDEENYILVYNNHKNPLLHLVFEGGENYLLSTVPQADAEYEYVSTPYIKEKRLSSPQWVDFGYCDSLVEYDNGRFLFDGLVVRLLDNVHWCDNDYKEPVDILVLCRGFLGPVNELVNIYPASCVVLDGSLYKHSRERIKREYASLGIDVVDISQTGAVKFISTANGFYLNSF